MKQFSGNSALLAASVAALLSTTAANATVNLDTPTTIRFFAKELNIETGGNVILDDATVVGGWGFSSGSFYVRFDLDNGAKFGVIMTPSNFTVTGEVAATGATASTVTVAAGGNVGDTYVVFNYTLGTGRSIPINGVFSLVSVNQATAVAAVVGPPAVAAVAAATATPLLVKAANRNPISLRYRLFTDASTAANPGSSANPLKDKTAIVAKFDTGMSLSAATVGSAIANVTDGFLKFATSGAASTTPTVATLGKITLANTTTAMTAGAQSPTPTTTNFTAPAAIALSDIADLSASKSSLTIAGDFSAAFDSGSTVTSAITTGVPLTRVWLQTGSACVASAPTAAAAGTGGSINPTSIAADGKSVVFGSLTNGVANSAFQTPATVTTALGTSAGLTLCYQPNGTSAINPSDYTVSFSPVAQSGYTTSGVAATALATIKRNGAELQAPFANVITGYKSRIYLTNTGAQDAPFSMSVQTEPGTSFTPVSPLPAGLTLVNGLISGTIPKTGNMFFILDQVGTFTAASGSTAAASTRGSLIFKVAADCNSIQGMFQLRNLTTLDFDSAPLLRPDGHCQ